jgi:hypothetical protein
MTESKHGLIPEVMNIIEDYAKPVRSIKWRLTYQDIWKHKEGSDVKYLIFAMASIAGWGYGIWASAVTSTDILKRMETWTDTVFATNILGIKSLYTKEQFNRLRSNFESFLEAVEDAGWIEKVL